MTPQHLIRPVTIDLDQSGALPSEIKLLPIGSFKTTKYGTLDITDTLCSDFVRNFEAGATNGAPIDIEHSKSAAAGWVKQLIHRAGDGLYGVVDWTKLGKEQLTEKIYRFFSAEFTLGYQDPATSTEHGNVFIGGALTNRPVFTNLPALVLSQELTNGNDTLILSTYEGASMNIDAVRAKDAAALTDEEKAFLTEHRAELTADEQSKFGVAEVKPGDASKTSAEDNTPEGEKPSKVSEVKPGESEPKVVAASQDSTVTITASQFAALESRANAGMEAKIQLDKMANAQEAKAFTFSAENTDGVFLPKSSNKLETFLFSLNATQKTAFKDLMTELPKGTTKLFGEIGDGGNTSVQPSDQLSTFAEAKVTEAAKQGRTLKFSQAVMEVSKEHPELDNTYKTSQGDN